MVLRQAQDDRATELRQGHCMTASLGLGVGTFGGSCWRVGPRFRGGGGREGGRVVAGAENGLLYFKTES